MIGDGHRRPDVVVAIDEKRRNVDGRQRRTQVLGRRTRHGPKAGGVKREHRRAQCVDGLPATLVRRTSSVATCRRTRRATARTARAPGGGAVPRSRAGASPPIRRRRRRASAWKGPWDGGDRIRSPAHRRRTNRPHAVCPPPGSTNRARQSAYPAIPKRSGGSDDRPAPGASHAMTVKSSESASSCGHQVDAPSPTYPWRRSSGGPAPTRS